jgi:putative transposase
MCKQLKVSRAAYYKWTKRTETKLDTENKEVLECIKYIAESNNRLFGTLKMTYTVNKKLDRNYNHKRIYRLMCVHDLLSVFRRGKRYNWKRSKPQITAENILNRQFEVSKPNEVWCTDVTEIAYPGIAQKAYISSYLDLYDRSILGLHVSKRNDTFLTNESLRKAIEANIGATPLHHSDRGFQYTREVFKNLLESHGIKQSMSRISRCIDNGPMEGFQGIFKEILIILYPNLKTYEELEEAIYKTMNYYQNEYPQMRFKGLTPAEVRAKALSETVPKRYPITPNPQVVKFWNDIKQRKNQTEIIQLGLA